MHVLVPQLSILPSLVQRSLTHYFINESGFSEITFYQHDLQFQFMFSWYAYNMLCFGVVFHEVFRLLFL